MNTLNESDRAAYRVALLAEVMHERFPGVPWRELNTRPVSLLVAAWRMEDTSEVIADRRRTLIGDYYSHSVSGRAA